MSDADLDLFIAGVIEPKPVEMSYLDDVSDGDAWIVKWRDGENPGIYAIDWQPRAFCSDAQCTVMLMERPPFICATRSGKKNWIAFRPDFRLDGPSDRKDWPIGPNLGRIVAEAFALASGLPAEDVR